MSQSSNVSVYQFKVTLNGSKPPIWRRIQVRSDTTLYELHQILQVVMGWSDYHLHQFGISGVYYGTPDPEFDFEVKNLKFHCFWSSSKIFSYFRANCCSQNAKFWHGN